MNTKKLKSLNEAVRLVRIKAMTEAWGDPEEVGKTIKNKTTKNLPRSMRYPHGTNYYMGQHEEQKGAIDIVNETPEAEDHIKHLDDKIKQHHPNWTPEDSFHHGKKVYDKATENFKDLGDFYDKRPKVAREMGHHPEVVDAAEKAHNIPW